MQVIVHGGAGGVPEEPESRQAVLDDAASAGAARERPVEAVCDAVAVLESSPRFNAGTGGAVQSDGTVRTDAGIMAEDRSVGAACSMEGVENAVAVARAVMEGTPHVLLAGDRAVEFAADYGIETGVDCLTEETRARWEELDPPEGGPSEQLAWVTERFGGTTADPASDHDTVGAVASDGERVAAATSTGGRWLALAGRVGDVPQVGSGFYATPAGGASATGAGEDIARVTLSRLAVDGLEAGDTPETAAETAIEEFESLTGSTAGIIVCDGEEVGSAYNSDGMQIAVANR
ncbi:isoaspartyl peptidase/L-asparaginase [Natronorarus salvus]|uniref:isoaspartyl peptidase/L-asparaginase n=1 Tax=Natronorarus salvus TaxID=3117733 RepID=UPI002F26B38F